MFTLSAFSHLVDGLRAIHHRQRSDTLMRDLSPETRRDIGWPDRFASGTDGDRFWDGRNFR
ncbi:hypothetical protein [Aliihoeflea sp. 2WW]|uniref:hypothetical protein n=1 Tax=Aliihoeflea sp. 2WW TaxID=1381123 RepID=UPI0004675C74|nr:hypothetical protein [Aliihoeflea sp. 2WW]